MSELADKIQDLYEVQGYTPAQIFLALNGRMKISSIRRQISGMKRAQVRVVMSQPVILSALHARVGRKLLWKRTENGMSAKEFCDQHGFANPKRLREMETGRYDFPLSELNTIVQILETTFDDLCS